MPDMKATRPLCPEPDDPRTRLAMVRAFFDYSRFSLIAGVVMVAVQTAWVLTVEPSPWLWLWLVYCAGLFVLRWRWRRACLAASEGELEAGLWHRRAVAASFGTAAMWMAALLMNFRADDVSTQMFCAMLACLTCVGSINVMAPLPRAYWALAAPTLGLLMLQFLSLGGWLGLGCGALVLNAFMLSVGLVHRHARLLFHSHALRYEREALLAQVEQASQAKTRFLAAASHDLRQPLHALGLLSSRLQSELLTERQSEQPSERRGTQAVETAAQIDRMVQSLDTLVDGLLDVSRLDAGALQPQLAPVALQPLLEGLGQSFAVAAEARGLQWRLRGSTACVHSDALQLERVLRNLVDNALRYTLHGGVLLAVRERGDRVLISVWDTGPGIPPDQQRNVFEEFVQLHRGSNRQGLGLGLAIVARLCRVMDHELTLRSRVGRGSCFTLSLRRAAALPPALALQPAREAAPGPAHALPLRDLVVALVEDDAVQRLALQQLLEVWGCRVMAGADAEAVIAQFALSGQPRPEVVISDHRLGGSYGLDAIRQLREHSGRQLPALLMSSEALPHAADALAAQRVTPARKPVSALALRAWVSAQCPLVESSRKAAALAPAPG